MSNAPKHPAPFSHAILDYLDAVVPAGEYLDPFCGIGKVFELERPGRSFVGIELEQEWAYQAIDSARFFQIRGSEKRVWVGDALEHMRGFRDALRFFDGIVTSPVYGNRMSDSHDAQDGSHRRSYTHYLGRKLTGGNAGEMYFWQPAYKDFNFEAWLRAREVTRIGGHMFLNVKNFVRNRRVVNVVGWHMKTLKRAGWTVVGKEEIATPGFRKGENSQARVDREVVIHARRLK